MEEVYGRGLCIIIKIFLFLNVFFLGRVWAWRKRLFFLGLGFLKGKKGQAMVFVQGKSWVSCVFYELRRVFKAWRGVVVFLV